MMIIILLIVIICLVVTQAVETPPKKKADTPKGPKRKRHQFGTRPNVEPPAEPGPWAYAPGPIVALVLIAALVWGAG